MAYPKDFEIQPEIILGKLLKYQPNNEWFKAAREGNINKIKNLIQKDKINVNLKTEEGLTAVMFAAGFGYIEIYNLLLENGADVNLMDNNDILPMNAFSYAITGFYSFSKSPQFLTVLNNMDLPRKGAMMYSEENTQKRLINYNIICFDLLSRQKSLKDFEDKYQNYIADITKNLSPDLIVKIFKEIPSKLHYLNINWQNPAGMNLLMVTIMEEQMDRKMRKERLNVYGIPISEPLEDTFNVSNYFDICKTIIEWGINLKAKDEDNMDVLMYAVRGGNLDIIKMILEENTKLPPERKIDFNLRTYNGVTFGGYLPLPPHLFPSGLTALEMAEKFIEASEAIRSIHPNINTLPPSEEIVNIIKEYMQKDKEINENKFISDEERILGKIQGKWFTAIQSGETHKVKNLIENAIDIDMKNDKGLTALIIAAFYKHSNICKILISEGADMSITDNNGRNILIYACIFGD